MDVCWICFSYFPGETPFSFANFHIPVSNEAEQIKKIVHAPEGYEFICLLTMGYPAENAFLPKQKNIDVGERIHLNVW